MPFINPNNLSSFRLIVPIIPQVNYSNKIDEYINYNINIYQSHNCFCNIDQLEAFIFNKDILIG